MYFHQTRSNRLDTIVAALRSSPARAIFEQLKCNNLIHGDEVALYRTLAEIINAKLDELEGTRPGIDEPDRWWETE